MAKDDSISITKQELADMIASAVSAAVAATRAAAPAPTNSVPFNPDEQMRKQVDAIRGVGVEAPPVSSVRRTSARTGTTFTAVIFRGKCVRLEDEVFSPDALVHAKEGGMVPDGLPITDRYAKPTPQYKQWWWQQVRHPDLKELVGKDIAWLMRQTNEPAEVAA